MDLKTSLEQKIAQLTGKDFKIREETKPEGEQPSEQIKEEVKAASEPPAEQKDAENIDEEVYGRVVELNTKLMTHIKETVDKMQKQGKLFQKMQT